MKHYFYLFLSCLVGLVALTNCSKDEEVMTGIITGIVTDAADGSVLQGASVTLSPLGLTQTTGSDGRYSFNDITPDNYTLTVQKDGYDSNTKSTVVYAGQTSTVDVQLNSTMSTSKISISPLTLTFGPTDNKSSFVIKNEGNTTQQYSISNFPAELTVSPTSGTLVAKGQQTIDVTVNRAALTSDFNTTLRVAVGNNSYGVSINVNTQEVSNKLVLSTTSLNFGTAYSELQFSVRNVGTAGDLTWSISNPTNSCLSVSPKTGVTAMGGATPVTVTLNRAAMTEDFTSFINVNTNGGSVTLTVMAQKAGGGNTPGGGDNPGTGTGEVAVTGGLLAYYTFDDGTAADSYEGGLDGMLVQNPTFITETANGKGKAIFLNGTKGQYVNIPYTPLKGKEEAAISIWIKDFNDGVIISGGKNSSGYVVGPFICLTQALNIDAFRGFAYGFPSDNIFKNYYLGEIQDGNWHMLTINYTDNAQLFIDGRLVDTMNMSNSNYYGFFAGNKMQIGGNAEGGAKLFNTFKADNLRIYSRTLQQEEVKAIYNSERQ